MALRAYSIDLDGNRHFARLAIAEADLAGAVAHHRQRGEGELATALDGLGDAVDGDQLLQHAVAVFAIVACSWFVISKLRHIGRL
jgi:hypothetical protein